jgi:osmotically-inducible protein OsmY
MKPDIVLKEHVLEELEWEPGIKAAGIGVTAKDGVVTLSGEVESYHEKIEAERAALRVAGVKGMVSAIEVQLPGVSQRSDGDVARAAVHALEWNSTLPPDCIKVLVSNGWITLEGEVAGRISGAPPRRPCAVSPVCGASGIC